MEPDKGDAGEPHGRQRGVSPPFGGKGFPGESLIGTLLCGSYAAHARADVALLIHAPTAPVAPTAREVPPAAPRRRSDFRISANIDGRCASVLSVLCVPAHPPRFRAWSSFSAGTGMSRSPGCRLCSLMNRQSTNATKFTEKGQREAGNTGARSPLAPGAQCRNVDCRYLTWRNGQGPVARHAGAWRPWLSP
jgi:hypothetical protein